MSYTIFLTKPILLWVVNGKQFETVVFMIMKGGNIISDQLGLELSIQPTLSQSC